MRIAKNMFPALRHLGKKAMPVFFLMLLCARAPRASDSMQRIKFDHLTIEHGLSQNTINAILQDRHGFMWIATDDGLNRYDGYAFTVFRTIYGDKTSISDNWIVCLFEDKDGTLWIGTNSGGLNKFDPITETFSCYKNDPANPQSIASNYVEAIAEDAHGNLWIGTRHDGLDKFDKQKNIFTHFKAEPSNSNALVDNNIWCLYIDRNNIIWVGTELGGLNCYDPQIQKWKIYKYDPNNPQALSHYGVSCIHEDRQGNMWIGTVRGGLNCLNKKTGIFTSYRNDPNNPKSISNNYVTDILEDSSGDIWVSTSSGGLNKFDRVKGEFTAYRADRLNPHSLNDDTIWGMCEDRSGTIWFGTSVGGLNLYNRKKSKFTHYYHETNNPDSLSDNTVWAIWEDYESELWVGTSNGLNRFNRSTKKVTRYFHDPSNANTLSHNFVWAINGDDAGNIWIGTRGGLDCFNKNTERFTRYYNIPNNASSLSNNTVRCVVRDSDGSFWVGTNNGLNRLNPRTGVFTRYFNDRNTPINLANEVIRTLFLDSRELLWIGTNEGLCVLDISQNTLSRFSHDPNNYASIRNNRIRGITEDSQGNIWVGTIGGGLSKYDRDSGTFLTFTEKDGLANDTVYGVHEDAEGILWLSTNKGVSKFNPGIMLFRNYDTSDGLQSNEFNTGASHKNRKGEIFFGGINGFNAFFPKDIKDNPIAPTVVLTSFKILDKPARLDKPIYLADKIPLTWRDRYISFEFAALDYTAPEKNQYAYMLEGLDSDWIYSGHRRFGSYTNLGAGSYTLRIKAANNDGIWNESGVSLAINIPPQPWHTWWAYTLYGIAAIAIVLFYVRIKTRENLLASERKERHLSESLRAIAKALNSSLDLSDVLEQILSGLSQIIPYDGALVLLKHGEDFRIMAALGRRRDEPMKRHIKTREDSILAEIVNTPQTRLYDNVSGNERFQDLQAALEEEMAAWIIIPLVSKEEMHGMLIIGSKSRGSYQDYHVLIADTFTEQAATAMENARLFGKVKRLSLTDGLTGLLNRRHFFDLAQREFQRAKRYGSGLGILMVDLDNFKHCNDTYGHLCGDEVLKIVASRLRQSLRTTDILGRYGGEEFSILVHEAKSDEIEALAQRLLESVSSAPIITRECKNPLKMTISVGVALLADDNPTLESLIERADNALYRAKRKGKNRYEMD
ncbi:MAG: Diguanylate cyclase DosC [candidate division BRC1 bacterium ADurb.Bin183]|nr:MAG: Diguanylate cyclase DosC [candidate division BRC1 bacterium ADurb.Bin183]